MTLLEGISFFAVWIYVGIMLGSILLYRIEKWADNGWCNEKSY